jgi:phosphatidylglycerol:prolipoprotein diacylglycerol transferase
MYVLGFVASYFLVKRQRRARILGLQGACLQDLIFSSVIGLIVGARIGYIVFYEFNRLQTYLRNPLEIIAVWHGGMSFHGGLIGAVAAGMIFCWRRKLPFWQVADTVIVTAPIGLGLGRIGNFINGELYGRPSSMPWAMVFPQGGPIPRHPSQLYEAGTEGLLLFLILWTCKDLGFRHGAMVCLFLTGYGMMRFFAEFFRQPDPQIGLFWGWLSMGQLLCTAMIFAGILLWIALPKQSFGS